MNTAPTPEPKRIKSVAKAVAVLRLFGRGDPLTLAAIAKATNANPSSVYHLVQTLVDERMLRQDAETKKYSLGPGILAIAPATLRSSMLISVAESPIYECARTTGYDVWLGVLESDRVYYIARVDGANPLKVHMPLLRLQPAHCVAAGRVLLSNFRRDRVQAILQQHTIRQMTARTCTDIEALLDAVERAREQGFAEVEEEHIDGAADIAVPIRGDDDVIVAALSIGAPSHVFDREARARALPCMLETAATIEEALATGP